MNDLLAPLYEGWGLFYLDNFSDDLYNNRLYIPIGLTLLLSSAALMGVFYYVINHPRFNRWYHWLFYVFLIGALNFGVAYYISYTTLSQLYEQDPYQSQYYTFALVNFLYTLVFSFLFSYLLRWWSVNAATTPIPQ